MLTARDREIIALHTVEGPNERYPEQPLYAFKGRKAFDLHLSLVSLVPEFEERFTREEKENCALLVTLKTIVSKATLKNPELAPANPKQRIYLYFYSKEPMVSSRIPPAKKAWAIRVLNLEPGNLIHHV